MTVPTGQDAVARVLAGSPCPLMILPLTNMGKEETLSVLEMRDWMQSKRAKGRTWRTLGGHQTGIPDHPHKKLHPLWKRGQPNRPEVLLQCLGPPGQHAVPHCLPHAMESPQETCSLSSRHKTSSADRGKSELFLVYPCISVVCS